MGPQQLPGGYTLCVDWVQGDPFASPSRLRCAPGWLACCARHTQPSNSRVLLGYVLCLTAPLVAPAPLILSGSSAKTTI